MKDEVNWLDAYRKHIKKYKYANPKRAKFVSKFLASHGYYFSDKPSIAEIAAFSAKDLYMLKGLSPDSLCIAIDKEAEVLQKIDCGVYPIQADARALPFNIKSIDITFHSGLIIYFDDEKAKEIIEEQARVSKRFAFAFAHNKYNLVDVLLSAWKKMKGDPMYGYRRFSCKDLKRLSAGISMKSEVFLYDNMIENVNSKRESYLWKLLIALRVNKLPIFYNESVLILSET